MESPRNSNIPDDLIVEILLRLPAKTLFQFKSVCKNWRSLIETPGFIKEHYAHASNLDRFLARHYRPNNEQYSFALYSNDLLSAYEEPNHLQIPASVAYLMGPLKGVFCLIGVSGQMALLNPATRQFRPLPAVPPNVQPHLSSYDDLQGFGMDPITGDYKVVTIQYFWNEENDAPHFPSRVAVYTSGVNSWRHFEDMDLVNSSRCAYRSLCNTFLNGVYYWLTEFNENDVAVLAFDMSNEKFREIKVPDCIMSKEGDLALYGDSIALLSCDLDKVERCVDIWVMSTDGCWSKSLTVGPFQDIKWPLGFWKKNELLLETGSPLLTLYDVHTKRARIVEASRKENGFYIYWVFTYKESLVPLNGKGVKCKLWDTSSDYVRDFFR